MAKTLKVHGSPWPILRNASPRRGCSETGAIYNETALSDGSAYSAAEIQEFREKKII